jgi:hypothetical protein
MKMKTKTLILLGSLFVFFETAAQESYKLRLDVPLADIPQNPELPYHYPSMDQALNWSAGFYEAGFWGIDELGDLLFRSAERDDNRWSRLGRGVFKYALGLAFSKYGSELPVPLGVWGHEEFHRSVLGVRGISSNNGNWLFDRWDGTVYGLSDETLGSLKLNDNENLLYSYVAGVQYEILLNEKVTLTDFYYKRSFPKAALILYNAYYVWDYFRFSAGSGSDSAKVLAPPHESVDPVQRDYAGADLTAWIHDMFNPGTPYTNRDPFPEGNGVNRRIGYSDLSSEERDYLNDQKKLSLLNFLNPSIFFINRIKLTDDLSFNFFTQYSPVHFGNSTAIFLPVKFRETGFLLNASKYGSRNSNGFGFGLGIFNLGFTDRIHSDIRINVWDQPESFLGTGKITGGMIGIKTSYSFSESFSTYINISGKTRGWIIGDPYLEENVSARVGLALNLVSSR